MVKLADDRYIVVSADGHAGAQMHEYRDYLEAKYLDEFDEWAKSYVNPFTDLRGETAYRNWDSKARLQELEDDGVVAEVIFPNTIPPFFPSGNLLARPPENDQYELRWAGLKAHNRWLADFCADTPGRRAGMAQIFLNDVDDAVAEIQWAREHGLFGGILLPGVPPDSELPPLFATDYDPIWAACADLDMPVNNHSGAAGPAPGAHLASMAIFMVELGWFSHRVFWHMAFGGVFARYPQPEARAHRAVGRLGARGDQHARPPVQPLLRPEHRGVALRRRAGQAGDAPAELLLEAQLLCRRELLPSERGPAPLRDRCRQDHVGPGLPAHRRHVPVHHRGAAQHVRRSRRRRGRADGRAHRRSTCTASTSTCSSRSRRRSARRSTRSRCPSSTCRPTRTRSRSREKTSSPGER